jgi:selenocysteine-specific elongation factor
MSVCFLERTLQFAVNSNKLFINGEYYAHTDMTAIDNRNKLQADVENTYLSAKFAPPDFASLAEKLGMQINDIKAITQDLSKSGKLKSVGGQYYIHQGTWEALLSFLRGHFDSKDVLDVTTIKEFVDSTRKYVIPLLEFLDNKGYTVRQGDSRIRGTQL